MKGDNCESCLDNVLTTIQTQRTLGLYSEKSIFDTKQTIACLGFVISATNMTLSLTNDKKTKIKELSKESCNERVTTRKLTKLIDILAVSSSAVTFGQLQYRHLETVKITGLKYHHNDFDKKIFLMKVTEKFNGGSTILIMHPTILLLLILTLGYTHMKV